MKTYNITKAMSRHYPTLDDLLSEQEFRSYLFKEGINLSKTALRDFRYRDVKFAYIRKGHQVFYPIHVNKEIIKEMRDE